MSGGAETKSAGGARGGLKSLPLLWCGASVVFAFVGLHLAANQYVSRDLVTLWNSHGATGDGIWLSSFVVQIVERLPSTWAQTALSLVSAIAAGLLFAVLYINLKTNDWKSWQIWVLVASLGGNALILYAVTAANAAIPLIFACALLAPNFRRLESVGDVQAEMGLGLILPLFILAGPHTVPLVLVLAAISALSDPDGRRDWRSFAAMFLVAIMPSLIVMVGLLTMHLQYGGSLSDFLAPYVAAYTRDGASVSWDAFIYLCMFAPVVLSPIIYCMMPDRRMKPISALSVIGLPLYLVAGRALFGWSIDVWAPAAVLLAGFGSWLSVVRLRPFMRVLAVSLSVLSAMLSWTFADVWTDAAWKQALLGAGIVSVTLEAGPSDAAANVMHDGLRGRLER